MIGDHQRDSHSAVARHDPVAVLVEERLVRLVPVRPLPAGRLEEHRAELDLRGHTHGERRIGRFDAHCSFGWTMP